MHIAGATRKKGKKRKKRKNVGSAALPPRTGEENSFLLFTARQ
jgi:hypothetical protein